MSRGIAALMLIPTSLAFIFFLLASLSPAIIPSISMAYIVPHNLEQLHTKLPNSTLYITESSKIEMGVLGVCYYGPSVFNLTTAPASEIQNGTEKWCTPARVGWTLDPGWFVGLESGLGYNPNVEEGVIKSLDGAMGAFNLLGAGCTGLATVLLLLILLLGHVGATGLFIIVYILVGLATLFAWIALGVNIGFIVSTQDRIKDHSEDLFNAHTGKAVWLEAAVAIMITLINCFAGRGSVEVGVDINL